MDRPELLQQRTSRVGENWWQTPQWCSYTTRNPTYDPTRRDETVVAKIADSRRSHGRLQCIVAATLTDCLRRDAVDTARNRARRQSGFPTFIPCQRQDANVLPKRRQSHQGDKLCDVSTVPLVARWPVFLARGSDADGEPHFLLSVTAWTVFCTGLVSWGGGRILNLGIPPCTLVTMVGLYH